MSTDDLMGMATRKFSSYQDAAVSAYGDVPLHPMLARLKRMEAVEREQGYDRSALFPRFMRWLRYLAWLCCSGRVLGITWKSTAMS